MRYRFLNTPIVTPFIRVISVVILKMSGWKIVGEIPAHVKKYVATVAPHTSNWDFLIMLMAAFVLRVDAHWMGKHTLFRFPFRRLMTYFGGIPVDRSTRHNMVVDVTAMFRCHERFGLGIAPEGTRKSTMRWRTGFWYVAKSADVPVYTAFIDYKTKTAGVSGKFHLSDNLESDMENIKQHYSAFNGRQ